MLNIRTCSIELQPGIRLARRVDIHERNSRHRKARLLQQRLRTNRNIHGFGEHANTATIVLKDITLRKRSSSVLIVIIDRIGEPRRLRNTNRSGCAQCCFVVVLANPLRNDRKLSLENLVGSPKIGLTSNLVQKAQLRKQFNPLTARTGVNEDLSLSIHTSTLCPHLVSL